MCSTRPTYRRRREGRGSRPSVLDRVNPSPSPPITQVHNLTQRKAVKQGDQLTVCLAIGKAEIKAGGFG